MTFRAEWITALVDSREQEPYSLHPLRAVVESLPTADYSVAGLQDLVAVERKSLADFTACCGPERERFKRELLRMRAYRHRAVVVEADWATITGHDYRSRITPASVKSSIASWAGLYNVPLMLCGDRAGGQDFTIRFLTCAARHEWDRLQKFHVATEARRGAA